MAFDTYATVVKADDLTSFSTLPLYSPGAKLAKVEMITFTFTMEMPL